MESPTQLSYQLLFLEIMKGAFKQAFSLLKKNILMFNENVQILLIQCILLMSRSVTLCRSLKCKLFLRSEEFQLYVLLFSSSVVLRDCICTKATKKKKCLVK